MRGKEQSPPKLPATKECSGQDKGGISLVGRPNPWGADRSLSSPIGLLIVSTCLKEVCSLPIGKTDFFFWNQHRLDQVNRGQVDFDQKCGSVA